MKMPFYRPKIEFEKSLPELVAVILHAILFLLGGMLLARWFWLFFSPTSPPIPIKMEQSTSSQLTTILSANWFSQPKDTSIIAAPVAFNFKLVGIYAPSSNKQGFAIFKLEDGKQRAVLLHQEIIGGVKLQAIKPDEVEVGQEDNTRTVKLESRKLTNREVIKPITSF